MEYRNFLSEGKEHQDMASAVLTWYYMNECSKNTVIFLGGATVASEEEIIRAEIREGKYTTEIIGDSLEDFEKTITEQYNRIESLKFRLARYHGLIGKMSEDEINDIFERAWDRGYDQEKNDLEGVVDSFADFARLKNEEKKEAKSS